MRPVQTKEEWGDTWQRLGRPAQIHVGSLAAGKRTAIWGFSGVYLFGEKYIPKLMDAVNTY